MYEHDDDNDDDSTDDYNEDMITLSLPGRFCSDDNIPHILSLLSKYSFNNMYDNPTSDSRPRIRITTPKLRFVFVSHISHESNRTRQTTVDFTQKVER